MIMMMKIGWHTDFRSFTSSTCNADFIAKYVMILSFMYAVFALPDVPMLYHAMAIFHSHSS